MKEIEEIMSQVSDIAYEIGFGHESSFIRAFKREYGKTPGEVRREGKEVWEQSRMDVSHMNVGKK